MLSPRRSGCLGRSRQRGLSLVEMMVGVAVGLIVVAAAATLVAAQLSDNRRLLLEVQVQQDLRASADIITRDLRRAGSWSGPIAGAIVGIWKEGSPAQANSNLADLSPLDDVDNSVTFRSSRTEGSDGPYTYQLDEGVIKFQPAPGLGWQALTDSSTMRVTQFDVTALPEPEIRVACPKLCADGTQDCWPTISVRSFVVEITGQAVSDPAVVRSIRSVVRMRNDGVAFNDAGAPTLACPA
jgi:prepilin-type N-terminal cleavage/methylation domain-containing protein